MTGKRPKTCDAKRANKEGWTGAYWLKRTTLAFSLAIPAWLMLNLLCYAITIGLIGPWGAALENIGEQDVPAYTAFFLRALQIMLILGAFVIGWKRSQKMISP